MTFDPEQNRIPTGLLTDEEWAALEAVKYGWERFQYSSKVWVEASTPVWDQHSIYRAKPAPAPTIIVNGIEVPEPVREALRLDQTYWVADLLRANLALDISWSNDAYDTRVLNRGLIHLTESAAVAHAKAMLAPSMLGDV